MVFLSCSAPFPPCGLKASARAPLEDETGWPLPLGLLTMQFQHNSLKRFKFCSRSRGYYSLPRITYCFLARGLNNTICKRARFQNVCRGWYAPNVQQWSHPPSQGQESLVISKGPDWFIGRLDLRNSVNEGDSVTDLRPELLPSPVACGA